MILNLYSIYDKKARQYGQVLTFQTDDVAFRHFRLLMADEDTLVAKYPADFEMYCIGKFDSEKGFINSNDAKYSICDGAGLSSEVKDK